MWKLPPHCTISHQEYAMMTVPPLANEKHAASRTECLRLDNHLLSRHVDLLRRHVDLLRGNNHRSSHDRSSHDKSLSRLDIDESLNDSLTASRFNHAHKRQTHGNGKNESLHFTLSSIIDSIRFKICTFWS